MEWSEGYGKYGVLKPSLAADQDPAKEVYVGGLRDPFKVVNARVAMLRVRAAWEALVRKMPHATQVAESYGTKECYLDKRVVEEWKASLRKVFGAAAPKAVRIKGRYEYTSPRDPGLLEAWTNKSGDPRAGRPHIYRLPTPRAEPDLWRSNVAASNAWASLK